ncbi:hypothetical protein ACHAWF_019016 [Thalassiosira exigua]
MMSGNRRRGGGGTPDRRRLRPRRPDDDDSYDDEGRRGGIESDCDYEDLRDDSNRAAAVSSRESSGEGSGDEAGGRGATRGGAGAPPRRRGSGRGCGSGPERGYGSEPERGWDRRSSDRSPGRRRGPPPPPPPRRGGGGGGPRGGVRGGRYRGRKRSEVPGYGGYGGGDGSDPDRDHFADFAKDLQLAMYREEGRRRGRGGDDRRRRDRSPRGRGGDGRHSGGLPSSDWGRSDRRYGDGYRSSGPPPHQPRRERHNLSLRSFESQDPPEQFTLGGGGGRGRGPRRGQGFSQSDTNLLGRGRTPPRGGNGGRGASDSGLALAPFEPGDSSHISGASAFERDSEAGADGGQLVVYRSDDDASEGSESSDDDLPARDRLRRQQTGRWLGGRGPRIPEDHHRLDYLGPHASPSLPQSQLRRRWRIWYRRKVLPYRKLMVAQLLCVVYILVLTFSPAPVGMVDPSTGDIVDVASVENTENGVLYVNGSYRPVVAVGGWQRFCLAISRMSAFSMYPMLVVVFFTKMRALQSFLAKTPLSIHFGVIKEGHAHHTHAGRYITFDVWIHTLFHILRWASQGNMRLLWTSPAGVTGLITIIVAPLITFPMMYYKPKLRYEIRKGLHYLFYVFAITMCFHVPTSAIPNGGFIGPILGLCIFVYTLDAIYVHISMTEKIETTAFHVLSSGVRISMPVSERFQKRAGRAGYAYICIPWIDDCQWHPFSLFVDPSDPSMRQVFLMKAGDWTGAVHDALARDTTRPCWIKGPFPSPYSHASMYDNQILVASGIGITPALAAINAFKSSRRINLIWAVRDPEMLEFFLEHLYLDHSGWNLIFYTGDESLKSGIGERSANENIRINNGRPNLSSLIPNIVFGNESESPTFSLWEESEEQFAVVKGLDDDIKGRWGIMYCGGSKGVLSALRGVSIDYGIDLHVDSFAW